VKYKLLMWQWFLYYWKGLENL